MERKSGWDRIINSGLSQQIVNFLNVDWGEEWIDWVKVKIITAEITVDLKLVGKTSTTLK